MTLIVDPRIKRLPTKRRDGLYYNQWKFNHCGFQKVITLPLEVPLPDGGMWQGVDYGLIVVEHINVELRKHGITPLVARLDR